MARGAFTQRVLGACKVLAGLVALFALCLLSWQGWRALRQRDQLEGDLEVQRECELVAGEPEGEAVAEGADGSAAAEGEDAGQRTMDPEGLISTSCVSVSEEEGEVEQVATRLLTSYRDAKDCVLGTAGYLDLLGSVWACVVQGDGWVDICVIDQVDESSCHVHVMRLDASEARDVLVAGDGDEGSER